jgi:hypothetical protein
LYASPYVIRVITQDEMGGACRTHEDMRNAYNILVGKPEGKRPLKRPMPRLKDNIKKDLRGKWWEFVDWIHLAQNRDQ